METGCLLHCLEVEETNVFEAVKQSVTTRQAALVYGISVGRNGMACCPFHDDRHPSMKVDRRFHCFACQADGDVIDFTSRLFGLSSKEAALKLAEDFSISFDRKGHDPPQKRVNQKKNQRGNAIPAGRAEMLSGAVRLPAFAGTMERRICAQTTGG